MIFVVRKVSCPDSLHCFKYILLKPMKLSRTVLVFWECSFFEDYISVLPKLFFALNQPLRCNKLFFLFEGNWAFNLYIFRFSGFCEIFKICDVIIGNVIIGTFAFEKLYFSLFLLNPWQYQNETWSGLNATYWRHFWFILSWIMKTGN